MARTLSIGEVASLTGLPVKTIRFYTDEGLVPRPERTEGGHRRYRDDHVARLELIRALRELDVDLPSIRALLERRLELGEVLQAQLAVTESHLSHVQRRAAVLEVAVQEPTEELILRLPALTRLEAQERGDLLRGFWGRVLDDVPGDPEVHDRFRSVSVPDLPADAGPQQLRSWLELADLATDRSFQQVARRSATWLHEAAPGPVDVPHLMATTHEAVERVVGLAPDEPVPTDVLDAWVGAYASVLARRDDHTFRVWLLERHDEVRDPRFTRFWQLVGELNGDPPMPDARRRAAAVERLIEALRASLAP